MFVTLALSFKNNVISIALSRVSTTCVYSILHFLTVMESLHLPFFYQRTHASATTYVYRLQLYEKDLHVDDVVGGGFVIPL